MRRVVAALGVTLALGAPNAAAQLVDFYLPSDSALAILTGARATVDLRVCGSGASAYDITIFLDDGRVRLVQADSVPGYNLPKPTVTPGSGQVTIAASGTGYQFCYTYLARLTFEMDSLAQRGTLLSLRVNALINGVGSNVLASHTTGLLNVCQAVVLRGDVTLDRKVTSRDALVTLTAAVGLPVPGFQVMPGGDIDLDKAATSRDALFMLSLGIGVYTGYESYIKGIANACAPLFPAPDDYAFFRGTSLYRVRAGDTIPAPWTIAVAPYVQYPPRWSPDGRRILYTGYTGTYYYEILAFDTATAAIDTLTRNTQYDAGADWSPDGSRIAFISYGTQYAVFVMNTDGTGRTQVTSGMTVNTSEPVSWSPDGTRIAFVAYQTCCNYGIWTVAPDGSGLTEILPGTLLHYPARPVWSTAGDSIIYYHGGTGRTYQVPATPAATGVASTSLAGGQDSPAASSIGAAFRSFLRSPYDFVVRRVTDGRHFRLHRATASNNDQLLSFRRTGVPYVDTVTVAPDSAALALSGTTTQQFTSTVKNNDGSSSSAAVQWISREPLKVSVDATGLVTALDTTLNRRVAVLATVGGWRSDSAFVRVNP